MRIKTPSFWYAKNAGLSERLQKGAFWLLSLAYGAAHKIHQAAGKPRKASMPVICVGNITAGGSGKTPAALALMKLIQQHKLALKPHFLTRGYGGEETGPTLIDLKKHRYPGVGDESLILAKTAPCVVARERFRGAQFAAEKGADMVLMDDGLQNQSIIKDFSFVVIDGTSGFGNGMMIPAGPLRQPLAEGLKQAGAFIIVGEDRHNVAAILPAGKPVLSARIEIDEAHIPPRDASYLAFAGLGRPEKFRNTLESIGLDVKIWKEFPDHYSYTLPELQGLLQESRNTGTRLLTTEKDLMRIPDAFHQYIETLPVSLRFEDPNSVVILLSEILRSA